MPRTRYSPAAALAGLRRPGKRHGPSRGEPGPLAGKSPRLSGGQSRFVETDDGACIHVWEHSGTDRGSNHATVVLVHGLTASMHDWGPIGGDLIAAGYDIIAIEQRGHGESSVGRDGFGAHRQARDLRQVLATIPTAKPIVLVGHSMGAIALAELAATATATGDELRSVRALVLISGPPHLQSKRAQVALRLGAQPIPSWVRSHALRFRTVARFVAFGPDASDFMVDEGVRSALAADDAVRRGATRGLLPFDVRGRLTGVRTPVVLLAGSVDRLVPAASTRELLGEIAAASYVEYRRSGHMVIWENWAEISAEIQKAGRARGLD